MIIYGLRYSNHSENWQHNFQEFKFPKPLQTDATEPFLLNFEQ